MVFNTSRLIIIKVGETVTCRVLDVRSAVKNGGGSINAVSGGVKDEIPSHQIKNALNYSRGHKSLSGPRCDCDFSMLCVASSFSSSASSPQKNNTCEPAAACAYIIGLYTEIVLFQSYCV